MWMTRAAFFDADTEVVGTEGIKPCQIAGDKKFNDQLYWVDVKKEGAEQWIKGYVRYFINLGASFLRIDFLENYERNYGSDAYEQALKWISEEAGDELFLSLVMPNCYNHGVTEIKYGDMIRVSNDCFKGGWDFISDRNRGRHRSYWPQYDNVFDVLKERGFIEQTTDDQGIRELLGKEKVKFYIGTKLKEKPKDNSFPEALYQSIKEIG